MATMVQAEGMKSKGKKSLAHLEIHPRMGGGVTVRHHYSGYDHEPKEYHFKEGEEGKAMAHIGRHAGLSEGHAATSEPENAEDAHTEGE